MPPGRKPPPLSERRSSTSSLLPPGVQRMFCSRLWVQLQSHSSNIIRLKSKASDRACPERSRSECRTPTGSLSTPMRLGGFGADHMIKGQQHNGAQDRHDEACGLSFLIPAQCSAGIGCNERSCDADQHVDNDSTRVLAGHEKFRYRTDYQADQQCPYEMHTVSSSARMACGRSQLFVGRQTSGPRV